MSSKITFTYTAAAGLTSMSRCFSDSSKIPLRSKIASFRGPPLRTPKRRTIKFPTSTSTSRSQDQSSKVLEIITRDFNAVS
ncbi:hypothetical protein BHE90_002127 [Fusarium euwallaceae]|uniref:Uncharacterized protein n=2 Tax=Fusarium solani species complex TaxID=232080 RepID=A0A3M2SL98_9HYPO|nr:hypothetical protein CDV36_002011 [Fusarium kuroshium]RTE83334.1 hypothetical protein BHE90_002127 [Fusarium euwallaceae]